MAAMVLNSPLAVEMSVQVARAFVRLREILASNKMLGEKLAELERKVASHDGHIRSLFEAIRQLMRQPSPSGRRIGFGHAPDRSRPLRLSRRYSESPRPWWERGGVRGVSSDVELLADVAEGTGQDDDGSTSRRRVSGRHGSMIDIPSA
jgi:hypothetical protein